MNGAQDMGGQQNFGPVVQDPDNIPFHAEWEKKAFSLALAMGASGAWNLDQSRLARESLPPHQYLASTYYEIWFAALQNMLLDRGLVSSEEISTGKSIDPPKPLPRVLKSEEVVAALGRGGPVIRDATKPAGFKVGDRVTTVIANPMSHTRLPRYARGRTGVIHKVHGFHVFADSSGSGQGEAPEWLYSVEFDAKELWGDDTTAASVCVDLWEPHLTMALSEK